jgi:hypothetical protein
VEQNILQRVQPNSRVSVWEQYRAGVEDLQRTSRIRVRKRRWSFAEIEIWVDWDRLWNHRGIIIIPVINTMRGEVLILDNGKL